MIYLYGHFYTAIMWYKQAGDSGPIAHVLIMYRLSVEPYPDL